MAPKKGIPQPKSKAPQGPARELKGDTIRHLEKLMRELEVTMEDTRAHNEAVVERTIKQADRWFENIIRTVPQEVLDRPFREVYENTEVLATPRRSLDMDSAASSAASVLSAISAAGSYHGEDTPSTENTKVAASDQAKKVGQARCKSSGELEKLRMPPPVTEDQAGGSFPVIRPKFDIRDKPAYSRKPRPGETLVSLRGSPVVCEEHVVPDSAEGGQVTTEVPHSATRRMDSDAHHGEAEVHVGEMDDIEAQKILEGIEDPKKL